MTPELLMAVLAGLGGMFGWGFSEFAAKRSVDQAGTLASLVWAHVFGTIILFGLLWVKLFIYGPDSEPVLTFSQWVGLLFFGSLQAVVYYFAYKGFESGNVSTLSPIFASFAGIVALLSVLVFGEPLRPGIIPALILIFTGVILINVSFGNEARHPTFRFKAIPGLKEILIATALATVWTLGWDRYSGSGDWLVLTSFMFLFMTISAFIIARFAGANVFEVKPRAWRFFWFLAVGEVVAYLAITLGYANTSYTSIVAILSGASSLPTIILARIFLKERMSSLQIGASLVIIVGIAFLAIH